jgi:hypothetical protein
MAWLLDSLSTLRSAGCPNTTQDSLPAAGQALPGEINSLGSSERFQFMLSCTSPSPKLAWRNFFLNVQHQLRLSQPSLEACVLALELADPRVVVGWRGSALLGGRVVEQALAALQTAS